VSAELVPHTFAIIVRGLSLCFENEERREDFFNPRQNSLLLGFELGTWEVPTGTLATTIPLWKFASGWSSWASIAGSFTSPDV
jgi:hypothetical protein